MPSSLLFATNSEGRVYTLSTSSGAWREFPYLGLEFKKISAVPHFMWAVGGDRQIYVHVHGLDVPIRVKEESYENERWLPIEGFSKKLLPTDRYKYSSADGSVERSVEKIRLPSMAWQWDGEWHLDLDLDGQTLAEDGWMYALDFPATYSVKNSWNSYVRRRKWVRFRRYSALNSWCAVAPLHKDPTQEPFIDVAIGGTNVPNAPAGTLIVWAITAHGRAMFRTGISATAPEGLRWNAINTPAGCELSKISVGPTGLVWAVLYNGRVLVRSGVTRNNLSGETWLDVKPPGPSINAIGDTPANGLKILQVSVGTDAVWCVTSDNHVWFRRGIKGEVAGISEDAAIGSGWVEMVGNISSISVAANDQVFGVGASDRSLYFRSGVSGCDLTGKKWRLLQCPMQISRTPSSMSIVSRKSGSGSTPGSKHQSFSNLYNKEKEKGVVETCALIETVSLNSPVSTTASSSSVHARLKHDLWRNASTDSPPNIGSLNLNERYRKRSTMLRESAHASSAPATEIVEVTGKHYEAQLKNPRAWSPVRSVGSVVGTEAHPESDSAVFESDSSAHHGSDAFLGDDDDHANSQFWTECEVTWSCVAAGAVSVDPAQLPNWFNEQVNDDCKLDLNAIWRQDIIEKLKQRQLAVLEVADIERYEKAVELSSWIKSSEARFQRAGGEFEDCHIELEWVSGSSVTTPGGHTHPATNSTTTDSGTFTVLNPDGVSTKIQFSLSNINCVQCCSEPGAPRVAIHASHLPANCSPVRLQFSSDNEMEDWLSHLSSVCCQINELSGKPANNSIWITSDLGDVFVFDPLNDKQTQIDPVTKAYVKNTDVTAMETPYYNTLNNGLPRGSELQIEGCVYDDADQIRFDLQCHPHIELNKINKVEKFRVIALHLNPRFNERTIVLNSMEQSEWLDEIRNDKMVFAPGATFRLKIRSLQDHYEIHVNDIHFADYKYRTDPEAVTCLYVSGRVKLFNIVYRCPTMILSMPQMFWRQMGGHLKRVFACSAGIVWGISCDNTAWVYNGGWGGNFMKGLDGGIGKINTMIDTHTYYVYENQRWNPISGFTTKSLPTDRHMWSDASGRQKRNKEHTKLLSTHCEWISDWMIDFNIPGGADKEGWQYAIDFPASYHGQKKITDCVRRRRWMKKSRLSSSGPWQELSHSKILYASLQVLDEDADNANGEWDEIPISAWAIASNGDVLIRHGVTSLNPRGESWEHLPSEQPLIAISVGPNGQVWTVGRNGMIFYRYGINKLNPLGDAWQTIEAPAGITFKTISVGRAGIWAIDNTHRLAVRKEITKTFPEGSHWQFLPNTPTIPPHTETHVGFKSVSVGSEVWAVAQNGVICKRCGITKENPAGVGWNMGVAGQWQHLSIEAYS